MDLWSYDDRNELTGSERYANTDPNDLDPNNPDPGDALPALDRAYVTSIPYVGGLHHRYTRAAA